MGHAELDLLLDAEPVSATARELSAVRRSLAAAQQKLTTTTRTLEARTKQLAEARAALALLQATLEASQDGILARGYFGRAMHFNARFAQMWDIPVERIPQLNDSALLALQLTQVKDPAKWLEAVQAQGAHPDREQLTVVELTGGLILECHMQPQKVRGRRVGSITYFRDVTDRDRLERVVSLLEFEMPEAVAEAKATVY